MDTNCKPYYPEDFEDMAPDLGGVTEVNEIIVAVERVNRLWAELPRPYSLWMDWDSRPPRIRVVRKGVTRTPVDEG